MINYLKNLMIISIFIMLVGSVSADTCYYANSPLFSNQMPFVCSFDNVNGTYDCLSTIKVNGKVIQNNPERKNIIGYGVIDSFDSVGSSQAIVRGYFKKQNIFIGNNFSFNIECYDSSSSFNYTYEAQPMYKNLYGVVYQVDEWNKNLGYIVGGGILSAFLVWLLFLIIKKARE